MPQITEDNFEQFLRSYAHEPPIDLRAVQFIDPYGMIGLLEIGALAQQENRRAELIIPDSGEVLRYLERMDFFRFACAIFQFDGAAPGITERFQRKPGTDVLLEITEIAESDDIHFIVGKVRERASAILERHLGFNERAINGFIVALSEVCQNIIEHSGGKGYVGIQKYFWKTLERNVVKIAVMDTGAGFRQTLSERFPIERDFEAIEKGLLHGASRYADTGRGHGLSAVRRFVKEWNGKLAIRSGTAALAFLPPWAKGKRKQENLPPFPGAQISIVLPALNA